MERILEKSEQELYNEFIKEWENNLPFVTVQTSGSTGLPKLIHLDKEYMIESARRTISFFGLDAESVVLSCMSFKYIGGKMMIVRSLEAGCRLAVETPSLQPMKTLDHDLTLVALVPAQMEYVLDNIGELPAVKHYLIGGSALSDALRQRIIDMGLSAWESYAMTETASHVAIRKVEYDADGNVKPFYPLPGVELSSDADNRLIIVDMGREALKTNDIVQFVEDGGFYILGRFDDMINTGGKKVLPQTIENILAGYLPTEFKFAISTVPDAKWGDKIVLVLETCEMSEVEINSLKSEVSSIIEDISSEILPNWMRPKSLLTGTRFPRNENGKLLRRFL